MNPDPFRQAPPGVGYTNCHDVNATSYQPMYYPSGALPQQNQSYYNPQSQSVALHQSNRPSLKPSGGAYYSQSAGPGPQISYGQPAQKSYSNPARNSHAPSMQGFQGPSGISHTVDQRVRNPLYHPALKNAYQKYDDIAVVNARGIDTSTSSVIEAPVVKPKKKKGCCDKKSSSDDAFEFISSENEFGAKKKKCCGVGPRTANRHKPTSNFGKGAPKNSSSSEEKFEYVPTNTANRRSNNCC